MVNTLLQLAVSVTFTASWTEDYNIVLYWKNAKGLAVVDDVQMEKGGAATRFNHVENGSFEEGGSGWTLSSGAVSMDSGGKHGEGTVKMTGAPETIVTATQEITIKKSAGTTFLLSGWSKGNSIADLSAEAADKPDDKELISTDRRAGTLHGSMEDSSHQPRMEQIPSQTPMMWTASARPRPSTA